jgi:integrase
MAAAKGWRMDAAKLVKDKRMRAPTSKTLRQEVDEWLAGARSGEIRNKREQRYKPGVIRNYEIALRLRVLNGLGDRRLGDIELADLLELKEHLQGTGCSDGTIRNTFVPLQAIYRRARRNGDVPTNPTLDLGLPTAGVRERAATPQLADELLAALSDPEQALWATAFFAGLRRGELRALRVRHVDLEAATISVEHSWDDKEGEVDPKSKAGVRILFVLDALRPYIAPLVEGRALDEFVFGDRFAPFEPRNVARRAERVLKAIDKARAEDEIAPVTRWTLHEARHSFSTWMDAAGVSETRADRYMGHSNGSVQGRYRHQLAGQLAEDARQLDAWLAGTASGKVVTLAEAG